eukprot:SAG22_NODE_391_length_11223_cov_7.451187_9_plen_1317_part_01
MAEAQHSRGGALTGACPEMRPSPPCARRRLLAVAVAAAALACQRIDGFQLSCYAGMGNVVPAAESIGSLAMVFGGPHGNPDWMLKYNMPSYGNGTLFSNAQPPTYHNFRRIVAEGSRISNDRVVVKTITQTSTGGVQDVPVPTVEELQRKLKAALLLSEASQGYASRASQDFQGDINIRNFVLTRNNRTGTETASADFEIVTRWRGDYVWTSDYSAAILWNPADRNRDFYWRAQITFGEAFRAVLGCTEMCTQWTWQKAENDCQGRRVDSDGDGTLDGPEPSAIDIAGTLPRDSRTCDQRLFPHYQCDWVGGEMVPRNRKNDPTYVAVGPQYDQLPELRLWSSDPTDNLACQATLAGAIQLTTAFEYEVINQRDCNGHVATIEAFQNADSNGDGRLGDSDEIGSLLFELGIQPADACLDDVEDAPVTAGTQYDCEMATTGYTFYPSTPEVCDGDDAALDRDSCEIEPTGNTWVVNTTEACVPRSMRDMDRAAKFAEVDTDGSGVLEIVSHKALPLCCAPTVFLSQTVPFCAVQQQQSGGNLELNAALISGALGLGELDPGQLGAYVLNGSGTVLSAMDPDSDLQITPAEFEQWWGTRSFPGVLRDNETHCEYEPTGLVYSAARSGYCWDSLGIAVGQSSGSWDGTTGAIYVDDSMPAGYEYGEGQCVALPRHDVRALPGNITWVAAVAATCVDANGTDDPTRISSKNFCERRQTDYTWQTCVDRRTSLHWGQPVAAATRTECELVATGNTWVPIVGAKCLDSQEQPANVNFTSRAECEREATGNSWYTTRWVAQYDGIGRLDGGLSYTELLAAVPDIKPKSARCVKQQYRSSNGDTVFQYKCIPYGDEQRPVCGERCKDPTKTFRFCPASKQVINDCGFATCRPMFIQYGATLADPIRPPRDFRCWDSCRTVTSSTVCPHFNGVFQVDTLLYGSESSVLGRPSMDEQAQLVRLHELTKWIDGYARGCDELYGELGLMQECRQMRCHQMGIAAAGTCHARNRAVLPPCRDTCAALAAVRTTVRTDLDGGEPAAADCDALSAKQVLHQDGAPTSGYVINGFGAEAGSATHPPAKHWLLGHCRAAQTGDCSMFSSHSSGACSAPARWGAGLGCVAGTQCSSGHCSFGAPELEDRGVERGVPFPFTSQDQASAFGSAIVYPGYCCAVETDGCSGHGFCDSSGDCVCDEWYNGIFATMDCGMPAPPLWFWVVLSSLAGCGCCAYIFYKAKEEAMDWYYEKQRVRAERQMAEDDARSKAFVEAAGEAEDPEGMFSTEVALAWDDGSDDDDERKSSSKRSKRGGGGGGPRLRLELPRVLEVPHA